MIDLNCIYFESLPMHTPPPPSASSFLINLIGGLSFIASIKLIHFFYPEIDAFQLSIFSVLAAIIPTLLCELLFLKVHLRPSTGLIPKTKPDRNRLSIKLLGYYGSIAVVTGLYLLIPEYDKDLYDTAFLYLLLLLLIYITIGWLYFSEVDPRMEDPYDGFWHAGNLFAGRWDKVDKEILKSHVKSFLLRMYFIPLMFFYITYNVQMVLDGHEGFSHTILPNMTDSPALAVTKFFLLLYFFLAAIDTLFAVIGYLMTFRIFDSHIRSTDPTFLGWFVCIICYSPFWEIVFITSIFHDLYSNPEWYKWFENSTLLLAIWGPFVLIGMCLEALTTLSFGIRFSNLTYRGLISSGTFRLSKHPQYIFKMMNRFFFLVPFLSMYGIFGAIKTMLMFFGLCFIYYLRAKTEENHLSIYPEYVEYANWVNRNGIFRWVGKIFPSLIYSEERAKSGKIL